VAVFAWKKHAIEKKRLTRLHLSCTRARISAAIAVTLTIAAVAALLLASGSAALAQTPSPTITPPNPLAGKATYAQDCAACHGNTGNGDGPSAAGLGNQPTAFADPNALAGKTMTELFDITKNGNMQLMMPPWKNNLTDQQIWDVVGYIWTLHTSSAQLAMGTQIYEANCTSCHGPVGKGNPPARDLTDFAVTSVVSQTEWTQAVANGKGTMPAFAGKLADAERAAALEYVRSFSFAGPMFRGPLAKGTGVISGTVTNGTTNVPLANATVELGIFDQTSLLEQHTTQTDANGFYRFTELPTDSDLVFSTRVQYPSGVPYSSDILSFPTDKPELNLPVTVYETTTDPSGIRADQMHFIIEFDSGQVLVAELIVFSLDGNHAYIGDGSGVLHFTVPANAQGLQIDGSDQAGRFVVTADGFVDNMPLTPGSNVRQELYRYTLPYTDGTLNLARTLTYPTAAVNALISDVGEQATSQQLASQGVRQTQSGNYINLLGQNLVAGQAVTINLTNIPATAGAAASTTASAVSSAAGGAAGVSPILLGVLIGLAIAGTFLLLMFPMLRRRGAAPAGATAASGDSESLVDALARLDMAHEAGELTEAAYRDQRLRLKAQLRDVLRKETQG